MSFLMFILAAVGMSHILVEGTIFNSLKLWLGNGGWFRQKILSLMNCYQCSGFWSGAFVGLLMCIANNDPLGCGLGWDTPSMLFIYGCSCALLSPLFGLIVVFLSSIEMQVGDSQ